MNHHGHLLRRTGCLFGLCLLLAVVSAVPLAAQKRPPIDDVVKRIDDLYRADSSYGVLLMNITNPHWKRSLRMRVWTKGTEKTLIRILEPEKERGVGTLRIENEMWNYLPKTNKVIKIPPSMMMSSWMGSDFNNNDLVSEFTFVKDYRFEYTEVDDGDENTLYIKCTPREGRPIVWEYVVMAVIPGSLIPKWQRFYSENDELMRTMYYRDIKTFNGREIPSVIELIPTGEKENSTVLEYLELDFEQAVPDSFFTLRNLRKF
ncbi:MAG: outer membrane lipoprotein-sorting protein [Spirochaetales bacterium]|nr:outer membrane lipoprotein-sorting protein [Spirochaetales bacterium]